VKKSEKSQVQFGGPGKSVVAWRKETGRRVANSTDGLTINRRESIRVLRFRIKNISLGEFPRVSNGGALGETTKATPKKALISIEGRRYW